MTKKTSKNCIDSEISVELSKEQKAKDMLPPDECDGECDGCFFVEECEGLCDDKEFERLLKVITEKSL